MASLLVVAAVCAGSARAQAAAQEQQQQQQTAATTADARPSEPHVPLAQAAIAYDVAGNEALGGRLRTLSLAGTPKAPVRNTRVVVENRSPVFYNYAAGWATFYGEDGVRCGEGLWKLEAFAPREQVEVDTPGLRLTCTPATWRIVATTLLTRTGDVAKPREQTTPPPAEPGAAPPAASSTAPAGEPAAATTTNGAPATPPLEINVNGKTIPIQLGNPLEIVVGKERVRIVVQQAP
ncbi:MAG: hypothetical protein QOD42_1537 [Sphingomonadales bacterium]|jgi:hypothetical protein|nr:hypothetical protein [Sphingomonadales bacterium]